VRKKRQEIPPETAAQVLFAADRTCCVCRVPGKPVHIHHIDGDPSKNALSNLAVLCFDCHRETQIKGGFDRKLDSDQVVLYRDDWEATVAQKRVKDSSLELKDEKKRKLRMELTTSLAEIYRENKQYSLLAHYYHHIGNKDLRDKYIGIALKSKPPDEILCSLRALQGKPELIPKDALARILKRHEENRNYSQRARFFLSVGRKLEAARDYIESVREDLKQGRNFAAAFYMKEMVSAGLIQDLFVDALRSAREDGDLWWQVRALQELEWEKELAELLEKNAKHIEESGDSMLLKLLADVRGEDEKSADLAKKLAKGTRLVVLKAKASHAKKRKKRPPESGK